MSSFLPSELHRLVLGFLETEARCPSAAGAFLEESPALAEVAALKRGRNGQAVFRAALRVAGRSLVDVLDEYQE